MSTVRNLGDNQAGLNGLWLRVHINRMHAKKMHSSSGFSSATSNLGVCPIRRPIHGYLFHGFPIVSFQTSELHSDNFRIRVSLRFKGCEGQIISIREAYTIRGFWLRQIHHCTSILGSMRISLLRELIMRLFGNIFSAQKTHN